MNREQLTILLVETLKENKAWEQNDALCAVLERFDKCFNEDGTLLFKHK